MRQQFLTSDNTVDGIFYPITDINSVYDENGESLNAINKDLSALYYNELNIIPNDQNNFLINENNDNKTATIVGLNGNINDNTTINIPYKVYINNICYLVSKISLGNIKNINNINLNVPNTIKPENITIPITWKIKNQKLFKYSTTPQKVGEWIDGTPIWRVAIDKTLSSNNFENLHYCELTPTDLKISSLGSVKIIINSYLMVHSLEGENSLQKIPVSLGGSDDTDYKWYYIDLNNIEDPRYNKLSGFIEFILEN